MILSLLACTEELPGLIRGESALWDHDALPVFHIEFPDEDWEQVLWNNVDVEDDCATRAYTPATVRFENPETGETETYEDVGARWRGHASLRAALAGGNELPGIKLSFDEYVLDRTFHDVANFNLLGTEGDYTWMREHLAFELAGEAGLEDPRAAHALVYVNGEFSGIYPYSEEADDRPFMQAHFPDRAYSLYEAKGYCGDDFAYLQYRGPDPADYVTIYEPKAGTDDEDTLDDLIPMLECASVVSDAEFSDCLPEHVDIDNFLTLIALDHVLPDIDGLVGRAHNFMLMFDRADARFRMYAWDKDQSFHHEFLSEESSPFDFVFTTNDEFKPVLVDRMQRVFKADYCAKLQDVLPLIEPNEFDARVEALALFLWEPIQADPRANHTDWKYGIQYLMDDNRDWYDRISVEIAEGCR
jgi:spore coat protein CotH